MALRMTPDIDWSAFPESDGAPMDETFANEIQMFDLFWTLQILFHRQGRGRSTTVGGNQFIYYNPANGRDNISPDVYVAFDRAPFAPPKWQTWIEGKFPDIVFEITSPSTHNIDLSEAPDGKRTRYARLGAKEYYIFDPQQETYPPFLGFELRGERLEPVSLLASGGIYSTLLEAELRPMPIKEGVLRPAGKWLRVIDSRTGQPIPVTDQLRQDLETEQQARSKAEQARVEAEQARVEAEQARGEAEQARVEADERAARAEAALQALLRQQGAEE